MTSSLLPDLPPPSLPSEAAAVPDGANPDTGAPGRAAPGEPAVGARGAGDWTRALFERAPFGAFRCTSEGRLLDVNIAMAAMLGGRDSRALVGTSLFDALQVPATERARWLEVLGGGAPEVVGDLRLQRQGAPVHIRLLITAERDERGALRSLQGMAENVTERERREEIVRRGERMASLGRTLAGVAHEINNPLAAITGFAQILLTRDFSADDRHALETILQEARRAARIVKDLLTVARREEGSGRGRVDLNAIVRYLVETQRYAMETRGIQASLQLCAQNAPVLADSAQLEQVVLNLVVNARQALESRIEQRRDDDAWHPTLAVRTHVDGERVILEISDNGPGIPAADLTHIWDPFWTTREEGEGTGLGLAVVHSIVVSHGGTIAAESVPGMATRFTISLPEARVAGASTRSAPAAEAGPLPASAPAARRRVVASRPLDILVVDDEATIVELLARYFTTRGHAVVTAVTGEQALRLAEQGEFDVVISDLRMPGMDGRALIRRLHTLPSCARTRFILSTGDATVGPSSPGDDTSPAVDVVNKPYDVAALVNVVEGR